MRLEPLVVDVDVETLMFDVRGNSDFVKKSHDLVIGPCASNIHINNVLKRYLLFLRHT